MRLINPRLFVLQSCQAHSTVFPKTMRSCTLPIPGGVPVRTIQIYPQRNSGVICRHDGVYTIPCRGLIFITSFWFPAPGFTRVNRETHEAVMEGPHSLQSHSLIAGPPKWTAHQVVSGLTRWFDLDSSWQGTQGSNSPCAPTRGDLPEVNP